MIVHDLIQGSPEWLAYRVQHFNASDAPAMMGVSPHETRSALLKRTWLGLQRDFSDYVQERVIDPGHQFEALARPMAEKIVGEDLYPVTGSEGKLSASFDGLTMAEDEGFEHKRLNAELRAAFDLMPAPQSPALDEENCRLLPLPYRIQMEQQLAASGAWRILFMASEWTADGALVEERHCWYYPDAELRAAIIAGWEQFERDLAAYTPPAAAAPAATGRAPEALPALRIEVTGAVTASNLAEFKATALGAIRSVNRELRTDQDFADAEKAVKWCADVEARLKAAKDHALSQTADIDALFKALDEIADEARRVRLDVDKLVKRRKDEVREQAVAAARRALDQHIAALQAELAPMRLQPVPADFAAAIKGLRSIASMQDALDTTLANAKISADAQARVIRGNVAAFNAATGDDRALQALFADLGALVHEAADVFGLRVQARIDGYRQAEAAKEAARQAAEAWRIAEAEQRAREQAQREAAAELAAAAAPPPATLAPISASEPVGTGVALPMPTHAAPAANEPATLKLGTICERLGFTVSAAFLADVLHIRAADTAGRAVLYRESQWPVICQQLQSHISAMGELYGQQRAA